MDTEKYNITALTDEEFFKSRIDLSPKELREIPGLAERGNYHECRAVFASYARTLLFEDKYFSADKNEDENDKSFLSYAEKARNLVLTACGISYAFKGEVDWFFNATENGYKEWTWQLSRHSDLAFLARAYRFTKDEGYAESCANLLKSWIYKTTPPTSKDDAFGSLCWRTIECGIRMSLTWPQIIHSLLPSPYLTDDLLVDICKSVCEHADVLSNFYRTGNWLIMEMSGLCHIAVLFPFLADSERWLSFSLDTLSAELKRQVYPDGFQYELSTDYQRVLVIHYSKILRLLKEYNIPQPSVFKEYLKKLVYLYLKLIRPNGALPDINDGGMAKAEDVISPYLDLLDYDPYLLWVSTYGREGIVPQDTSYVLPYSGIAAFRSGWGQNDTWLLFDGGPFGRAHQHEDKLNVLMHADGKYILTEGNNYAYDTSEMRKYVLSSRAHNTAMVDNMEQNRRKNYLWQAESLEKHSGIISKTDSFADCVRATYREGYGENCDKTVTHQRSVYFIKKLSPYNPFALVVDRFFSACEEHDYVVMWHLDADDFTLQSTHAQADSLYLIPSNSPSADVCRGATSPQFNGWSANSTVQNDIKPVYCLKYIVRGKDLRLVTLLYPSGGKGCPVKAVEASSSTDDKVITLLNHDGTKILIDENDLLKL